MPTGFGFFRRMIGRAAFVSRARGQASRHALRFAMPDADDRFPGADEPLPVLECRRRVFLSVAPVTRSRAISPPPLADEDDPGLAIHEVDVVRDVIHQSPEHVAPIGFRWALGLFHGDGFRVFK
jgi:hypothetical protein